MAVQLCGGVDVKSTGIFPEEVWDVIFGFVEDSQDILNVLRAFPALDKGFQNKKSYWLIDQVLPHLMTKYLAVKIVRNPLDISFSRREWAKTEELLKLRLVSKRWKKAVDRSLESYANPNENNKSSHLPENHFNYNGISSFTLGTSIFQSQIKNEIDTFMEQMRQHSGNPFPGSSVLISPCRRVDEASELFVDKSVELFEKFGKYIQVLEIQVGMYDFGDNHAELLKYLFNWLSLVPNLKSLTISGSILNDPNPQSRKYIENPNKLFPSLPNLETFNFNLRDSQCTWTSLTSSWIPELIEAYGQKVRSLLISSDLSWIEDRPATLNNLTELHLLLPSLMDNINIARIKRILLKPLPNLRKLSLSPFMCSMALNIIDLIEALASFHLETVNINDIVLLTDSTTTLSPENPIKMAPTITSLSLWDQEWLTYEFLWWLPNLRFLSIYLESRLTYRRYRQSKMEENIQNQPLENRIRRYCLKAYNKSLKIPRDYSIWEEFPKLEMLRGSVQVDCDLKDSAVLGVQYVRECGNKAFFGCRPERKDGNGDELEEWVQEDLRLVQE